LRTKVLGAVAVWLTFGVPVSGSTVRVTAIGERPL